MEKINSTSLCTLVVGLSGSAIWGIISSYMFNTSKNSVLISMVLGFIISLIATKIILKMFNQDTSKNIIEKFKHIYGKFSIVFNIIFIIVAFSSYIFLSYRLTSFISSQYLVKSPKIFMQILIVGTTFYMASHNIETITRVSVLSLIMALVIYSFDIIALVKYIDIDNYLPIINTSYTSIIKSSLVFAAYFSLPTIYINIIKKDQITDKDKFNKTFYIMYTLSFIILFTAMATTLGIYGDKLSVLFDYPLYTVLKRITLFSFIDSIENISIMLWILYAINSSTMMLYCSLTSIKETFNTKSKIPKYILLVLSILIPRFFLMNNNYVESFRYILLPLVITLILFFIIIITTFLYKKKM